MSVSVDVNSSKWTHPSFFLSFQNCVLNDWLKSLTYKRGRDKADRSEMVQSVASRGSFGKLFSLVKNHFPYSFNIQMSAIHLSHSLMPRPSDKIHSQKSQAQFTEEVVGETQKWAITISYHITSELKTSQVYYYYIMSVFLLQHPV